MANRQTHEQVRIDAIKEAAAALRERGDRYWDLAPVFAESRDYESAAKFKNDAVVYFAAASIIEKLIEEARVCALY